MIIVNILRPVISVLRNAYLQPWLHVPVVMYNSRPFDISLVDIGVVAEPQDMPASVQWEGALPECYETRWKCS